MLHEKIQKALNEQLNRELYSAYLYYAMAAHAASRGYNGFSRWLHAQAQEELTHADKFFGHVVDRGGGVELTAVSTPPREWESIAVLFEQVAKHEREISSHIHRLLELARGEKDAATEVFLHWFVNEQVEEEKNADDLLARIRMVGPSAGSLLYLDKEAGKRKAGAD